MDATLGKKFPVWGILTKVRSIILNSIPFNLRNTLLEYRRPNLKSRYCDYKIGKKVVELLLNIALEKIIYVSCTSTKLIQVLSVLDGKT